MSDAIPNSQSDCPYPCCSAGLPATLTATINGSADCTCINGKTLPLNYNSATGKWVGSILFCTEDQEDLELKFYCKKGGSGPSDFRLDYDYTVSNCSGDLLPATSTPIGIPVCDQDGVDVDFNIPVSGACCGGASSTDVATVTVD